MVWDQGKGPATDLVFYVLAIKIDVDGYRASRWHHIIWTSCKYAINKIPTTRYVNAKLKRRGNDFTRNREGELFNLDPLGKIQMSKVKPIEWSTTPFSILCLVTFKLVEKFISLGWGRYGGQNSNLGGHPFLESVFLTCGASKCLGRHAQAIMHPCLSFTHPFHSRGSSLKQ